MRTSLVLAVVVLLSALASPALAAGNESDVSVFSVTQGKGEYPSQDYENTYTDIAVRPGSSDALVSLLGFVDFIRYSTTRAAFGTYDFGKRNYYYGVDWHPSGEYALFVGRNNTLRKGGVWMYRNGRLRNVYTGTRVVLQAVSFSPNGTALIPGAGVLPPRSRGGRPRFVNSLLRGDAEGFEKVSLPTNSPLRDATWSPDGSYALVTGVDGTLLRYSDGNVSQAGFEGDAFLNNAVWNPSGNVTLVGAESTRAATPNGSGLIARWNPETQSVTRRVELNFTVTSLDWKPDGSYALGVGRKGGNGTAFKYYSNGTVEKLGVEPKALLDVAWLNNTDALLVGDRSVWRYSLSTSPSELSIQPSLTVVPRRPNVNEPILLNGYGSTLNGSADRIVRWKFDIEGGGNATWNTRPRTGIKYRRPGVYNVSLRVESRNGTVSPWLNTTVVVERSRGRTQDGTRSRDGAPGSGSNSTPNAGTNTVVPLWLMLVAAGVILIIVYIYYSKVAEE
ncbi:MAG: hypothetical protein SV760_01890 [Halobacteria archaeon]|nr:hypothetical protein [Halobacteria archaeon]